MRPLRDTVVAVWMLVAGSGCFNLLPNPESRAAAVPQSADIAVGATHDLLIVACQDRVTLLDFVLPVAGTALFVGLGRLDAAFYLPGALVEAAIPKCKRIDYTVSGAKFDGDAFELEATPNLRAFKAHGRREGEAVFRAQVAVGDQTHEVSSTLRAWKPDRIQLAVRCDPEPAGAMVLTGYVPAGGSAFFTHKLFRGTTALTGYGYYGVSHPRVTFSDSGSRLAGTFTAERGPLTITSEVDPAFSLDLTTYDASDYDLLTLERVSQEHLFAGATTSVRPVATIGGKTPCRSSIVRTVTIETPAVCAFKDRTGLTVPDTRNNALPVEALTPGLCRLSVTMAGSALTASLQIPVFRSFEATPLPAAAVGVTMNLLDLWVSGPDDLVIVGWKDEISGRIESVTLRRTNGAWGPVQTTRTPPSVHAVHGDRASGAVFAVGSNGRGTRWTGAAWAGFDAGTGEDLNDVWVNGPNDAFAVGDKGTFVHFDGARWTALDAGTTAELRSVWGDGAGNVYAVGWSGAAKRFDGAAFTDLLPAGLADAGFHMTAIKGSRLSDLWILGSARALHFDGTSWTPQPLDVGVSQIWPVGDGYAYGLVRVGGSSPTAFVVRFDGTRTVAIPVPGDSRAISGFGNEVIVLSAKQLLRYRHDPADVFP